MDRSESFADRLFARRWALHIFFWLFVLAFYVIFFGSKNSNYLQTGFFVGLLMPVTIGTTYFLNYWLVPRFLMKERYGFFLLYFFYTLIGSLFLELIIALLTFIVMADLQNDKMSPVSMDIVFLLTSLLMIVFLGMAVKMVLHWQKSKEDYQKLERDKVEVELRFLKTQLHPHFLFNTLNNLYYLTLEKSDSAPKAVLALSELLDYVLRETKTSFVPLEKELQQVHNYIALESLRYADRLNVMVNTNGDIAGNRIAPMLLITLIENAFKHGVAKTSGKARIELDIDCNEDRIAIHLCNSVGVSAAPPSTNGVGLSNVRGMLKITYLERATLDIGQESGQFSVRLEIRDK